MFSTTSSEFYAEVGKNIRRFRKLQGITQQDLANKISRSLACISKYEKGMISIDLHTLYQIADALQVPPTVLFPQGSGNVNFVSSELPNEFPSLFSRPVLYLYTLRSKTGKVATSVIELNPTKTEATLYYATTDVSDYKGNAHMLLGTVWTSETNIRMHFMNPKIKSDFVFLGFHTADLIEGSGTGFFASMDYLYRFSAAKCQISTTPIRDLSDLKDVLLLNKEELQDVKRQSEFIF